MNFGFREVVGAKMVLV